MMLTQMKSSLIVKVGLEVQYVTGKLGFSHFAQITGITMFMAPAGTRNPPANHPF